MEIKSIERLTHQRLVSSYGIEPNPAGMKVYLHAEVVDAMQDGQTENEYQTEGISPPLEIFPIRRRLGLSP